MADSGFCPGQPREGTEGKFFNGHKKCTQSSEAQTDLPIIDCPLDSHSQQVGDILCLINQSHPTLRSSTLNIANLHAQSIFPVLLRRWENQRSGRFCMWWMLSVGCFQGSSTTDPAIFCLPVFIGAYLTSSHSFS